MTALDVTAPSPAHRSTIVWAATLLHALVRDEHAERRRPRLTEPGLASWKRFRGRLTNVDLVRLLFEDAAVTHPMPFDGPALDAALTPSRLPESLVDKWLHQVADLPPDTSPADYLLQQARLLGLTTRMARADLHVVQTHQKVLELPGTGGQLAHHLITTNPHRLTLQDNFSIACDSWQELTLAGIVALDLGVPNTSSIVRAGAESLRNPNHPLRQQQYDFVVGLHPDKGGLLQADNQLSIWFPHAKLLLV